jgi:hypothetical protein
MKEKRGGARPGSGRKKGTPNRNGIRRIKTSVQLLPEILDEIDRRRQKSRAEFIETVLKKYFGMA